MIPTLYKSSLLGHKYRLVGFLYSPHPESRKKRIQVTFFHQQNDAGLYLFCLSDVSKSQMREFEKTLTEKLGTIVGSEEVIPYVQRSISGATYDTFKEIIEKSFDNKAHWWVA